MIDATLDTAKEEAWTPTMAGNCVAYEPQSRVGLRLEGGAIAWQKWKGIPTQDVLNAPSGIPYPGFTGQLFAAIGLKGYEQAQAIAWTALAYHKATLQDHALETRVVPYEFKYDLKARELEDKAMPCKAEA